MDRRVVACSLLGLGFLAYVPGFLRLRLPLLAFATVIAAAGMALAIWQPRAGFLLAVLACLLWTFAFPFVGIGLMSTLVAALLAIGFAVMAYASQTPKTGLLLAGLGAIALADAWSLADNAIRSWTPGFAIGNVLFLAGCIVLAFAARAPTPQVPLPPTGAAPAALLTTSVRGKTKSRPSQKYPR